jgi:hypothetical protein
MSIDSSDSDYDDGKSTLNKCMVIRKYEGGSIDIEAGTQKYVLIQATHNESKKVVYHVRGRCEAEYHADAARALVKLLRANNWDIHVTGGGRIKYDTVAKTIRIYGYSVAYGLADHSCTAELIEVQHDDCVVSWTNEGY